MGYYNGDFYRGYNDRGDPGFFSFLGGLARTATSFIPGVGPGISQALTKIGGGGLARSGVANLAKSQLARMGRGIAKHPVLSGAGAAGALGLGAAGLHHLRGMKKAPGERRRRRMNPCNIKALRRSIRRAHSFSRIARKVLRFTSPRPPKGRMTFRVHRKKRVA